MGRTEVAWNAPMQRIPWGRALTTMLAAGFLGATAVPATSVASPPQYAYCGGQLMQQDDGSLVFWGQTASGVTGGLAYLNESSYQQGLTNAAFTHPRRLRGLESLFATQSDPIRKAIRIFCGGDFDTGHALLTDGTLVGWGKNGTGQIGNGDILDQANPVATLAPAGVVAIAAGSGHTLALLNNGTVAAWGANSSGQAGDGTTSTSRPVPAVISGLTNVAAIAAGYEHSIALLNDGTIKTWGNNTYGQLGIGNTASQSSPVTVTGISNVKAVVSGHYFSVALKTDGTVWAWGFNGYGELGNGTGPNALAPVRVGTVGGITAIATGLRTSFGLAADGRVWGWGNNNDANNALIPCGYAACTPTVIAGLPTNVTKIFVGAAFSYVSAFAATADGKIFAWGSNYYAGLGLGRLNYMTSPTTFAVPQLMHQGVTPSDFNRDYSSDVLFRNTTTGDVLLWNMRDALLSESDGIGLVVDTAWQIVGIGDADGDGKDDIFWRHSVTGENSVWFMDNRAFKGTIPIDTLSQASWKIVAVADFNGDGRADHLWRDESAGQYAVWLIGASGVIDAKAYGGVPGNWEVKGAADFNGDGKADIIWRDRNTGAVAIYRMDGVTFNGVNFLAGGLGEWDIVAVSDLDRDGYAEIHFRFYTGAALAKVDLNTTATSIQTTTFFGAAGGDWQIVAVGDYDADSHIDYLWRNSTGELVIWRLVNLVLPGSTDEERLQNVKWLGNPGNVWQVIGR